MHAVVCHASAHSTPHLDVTGLQQGQLNADGEKKSGAAPLFTYIVLTDASMHAIRLEYAIIPSARAGNSQQPQGKV